jgi:hypothetical protein
MYLKAMPHRPKAREPDNFSDSEPTYLEIHLSTTIGLFMYTRTVIFCRVVSRDISQN